MSGHKIDAEFIGKLNDARIAAHKEVETSTYYGFDPATRLGNFAVAIENGLGGDVGKFLGMLDPETVFLIVDELVVRRRRMRNIRTMADYDLGGQADIPTPMVSKSGTAVVIPDDNAEEARGVLEMCLGQGPSTLTLAGLARAVMDDQAGRVVALRSELSETKEQRDNYKQATQDLTEAADTWAATNRGLAEERDRILGRIIDWENAYRGGRSGGDLTNRVSALIAGYGELSQQLHKSTDTLKKQNDALEESRKLDDLVSEVDVLGAYLKYPVRETEAETRLEVVKAALTKIEEQDETIGALQQALVAAQSGQPRRPRGFTGTQSEPLPTWDEKLAEAADMFGGSVSASMRQVLNVYQHLNQDK